MSSYEMGQSSPTPSRLRPLKSQGPKRSEMRPQWFVRPPTIRLRHHKKLRARGRGVRLALEVPAPEARVELAERPAPVARAAPRRFVVPLQHGPVLGDVPLGARFEQHGVGARLGQDLRGHSAAGSGAHDAHVVDLGPGLDLHGWLPGRGPNAKAMVDAESYARRRSRSTGLPSARASDAKNAPHGDKPALGWRDPLRILVRR